MAAQVLSFFQRAPRVAPRPTDWSQQELAEFYRVEGALIRAGISVGTDRGLSDENEPWFCFYRQDDGEVVIHFARIDGEYLIAGAAYEEIARGFDFTALVRNMVARHPLIRRGDKGGNLSIHPAALLVAVVGTAFFKTGEARADEGGAAPSQAHHKPAGRPVLLSSGSAVGLTGGAAAMSLPQYDTVQLPANQAVLILAAALLASDGEAPAVTLDPAARAAISAAAAALDFGGVGGAPATGGEAQAILPATTHAVTVENSPAQTVSSVLALVSLLSTLPQTTPANGDGVLLSGAAAEHDFTIMPLHGQSDYGAWTVDVRLGVGPDGAPMVEAVQLVRGVAEAAGAQKITIIEVAKLPNVLAELIAKGDHHTVSPNGPTDAPPPPPTVTPEPGDTGQAPPPPVLPDPVKPPPPPASAALVKLFIDYFVSNTPDVTVVKSGMDVVMFDSRVLHDVAHVTTPYSVTFDFDDGSSISLVGYHSSFLDTAYLV